jgi:hypothetical protein
LNFQANSPVTATPNIIPIIFGNISITPSNPLLSYNWSKSRNAGCIQGGFVIGQAFCLVSMPCQPEGCCWPNVRENLRDMWQSGNWENIHASWNGYMVPLNFKGKK